MFQLAFSVGSWTTSRVEGAFTRVVFVSTGDALLARFWAEIGWMWSAFLERALRRSQMWPWNWAACVEMYSIF